MEAIHIYIIIGVAGLAIIFSAKCINLKDKGNEKTATLTGLFLILLSALQFLWLFL